MKNEPYQLPTSPPEHGGLWIDEYGMLRIHRVPVAMAELPVFDTDDDISTPRPTYAAPPLDCADDVSTPRETDCEAIREGRVTVLARDQDGKPCMMMVKHAK